MEGRIKHETGETFFGRCCDSAPPDGSGLGLDGTQLRGQGDSRRKLRIRREFRFRRIPAASAPDGSGRRTVCPDGRKYKLRRPRRGEEHSVRRGLAGFRSVQHGVLHGNFSSSAGGVPPDQSGSLHAPDDHRREIRHQRSAERLLRRVAGVHRSECARLLRRRPLVRIQTPRETRRSRRPDRKLLGRNHYRGMDQPEHSRLRSGTCPLPPGV